VQAGRINAPPLAVRASYWTGENFMNAFRKIFAVAALTVVTTGTTLAQKPERDARRLESITWNPIDHKLTWTVSTGALNDGKFEGAKKLTYEIRMDQALMSVEGEDRRFSKNEAVSVHRLMDLVAKYAAESTLWWEAGEGEPLDKDGSSSKVDRKKDEHKRRNLTPLRPDSEEVNGRKVIRISLEGREVPVIVRQIE
jgi:hypothetical protein